MGVIQRQGIKHSIVTYAGVVLGMVNVLFIYTYAFSEEQIGIIRYLVMASNLIVPFAVLGMSVVSVKYFPIFKNPENGHNGFLSMLLILPLVGFSIFGFLSFLYGEEVMNVLGKKSDLFQDFLPYILLITLALTYSKIFSNYAVNFHRIVVPAILNDFLLKVTLPTLALLYAWQYFTFSNVINTLSIVYFLITISLGIYIWSLGQFKLKINRPFFKKPLVKEISTYALYGTLGGIGVNAATQIDIIMAGSLIDLKSAGIYTIALFIANVIEVPKRSIVSITASMVSEHWAKGNLEKIEELYKKTSLTLFSISFLLLIGIWASLDFLFDIMPNGEKYVVGKYIVLILGVAKIIDLVTSINNNIIAYSDFYRFNLYAIVLLAGFNVIFNLYFIPIFDMNGVALATLTSMLLFNTAKCLFVYYKFKMHPFSKNTIWVLLIGGIAYGVSQLVPLTGLPLIDIVITSIVIAIVYIIPILYFNISQDLTNLFYTTLGKVRGFLGLKSK